jgi:manganese transport protein
MVDRVSTSAELPEDSGWRRSRGEPPLVDVFRTVRVTDRGSLFRRAMAFVGPGFLVAVGYMDPGNWATDLAAGSSYGFQLLWVVDL